MPGKQSWELPTLFSSPCILIILCFVVRVCGRPKVWKVVLLRVPYIAGAECFSWSSSRRGITSSNERCFTRTVSSPQPGTIVWLAQRCKNVRPGCRVVHGTRVMQVPSRPSAFADLNSSSCPAFLLSSRYLPPRITNPRSLSQTLLLKTHVKMLYNPGRARTDGTDSG